MESRRASVAQYGEAQATFSLLLPRCCCRPRVLGWVPGSRLSMMWCLCRARYVAYRQAGYLAPFSVRKTPYKQKIFNMGTHIIKEYTGARDTVRGEGKRGRMGPQQHCGQGRARLALHAQDFDCVIDTSEAPLLCVQHRSLSLGPAIEQQLLDAMEQKPASQWVGRCQAA